MKTTIVPAQVTTVEDKILGNLNLMQLVVLSSPVMVGLCLYAMLPPGLHLTLYKAILIPAVVSPLSVLAIRVRGKVLLQWVVVALRFHMRPRLCVFDKRDTYLRDLPPAVPAAETVTKAVVKDRPAAPTMRQLSVAELVRLEAIITNPQSKLTFKATKKGGISVSFTPEPEA